MLLGVSIVSMVWEIQIRGVGMYLTWTGGYRRGCSRYTFSTSLNLEDAANLNRHHHVQQIPNPTLRAETAQSHGQRPSYAKPVAQAQIV